MLISCEYKCRFEGRKCNSDQLCNNDKCRIEFTKRHVCGKDTWNPSARSCENRKYLASVKDNSTIMCDEIINSYDEETNFNGKKAVCKTQNLYILLSFLLITIALRISCWYLLLYNKLSRKTKTFITISRRK